MGETLIEAPASVTALTQLWHRPIRCTLPCLERAASGLLARRRAGGTANGARGFAAGTISAATEAANAGRGGLANVLARRDTALLLCYARPLRPTGEGCAR